MLLVDVLIEVLEKHNIDKSIVSDELAQAIASEVAKKLTEDDQYSVWSTEAKELLKEALETLKYAKATFVHSEQKTIELGNLVFKIEELLIKH